MHILEVSIVKTWLGNKKQTKKTFITFGWIIILYFNILKLYIVKLLVMSKFCWFGENIYVKILKYTDLGVAYLTHFSGGGITEYVSCLISQLLWKEKTPPIMMSPSFHNWGYTGCPCRVQVVSLALVKVMMVITTCMSAKNGSIHPLNRWNSETWQVWNCNGLNRKDFVIFIAMNGTKPHWENSWTFYEGGALSWHEGCKKN